MPPHLLSLPVETLDMVISFLVHPIAAHNLSRTCKYLYTHLQSRSNSFWYNLLGMYKQQLKIDGPWEMRQRRFPWGLGTYDPKCNYCYIAKTTYLYYGGCHLCFAFTSMEERVWLGKMGVEKESFATLGVRVCVSCFVEHTVSKFHCPRM